MKVFEVIYVILFFTTSPVFPLSSSKEKHREELAAKSTLQINFSNEPSWVKEVDYETKNIEENIDSTGVAHLLINKQCNLEKKVKYIRKVKKIVSKAALTDACCIPILFDFQDQSLIIHNINIIRNGEVIDKLATAKRKHFYPSPGDSSPANITEVFFYIDNLHAGDVIDISYSFLYKDTLPISHLLSDTFNIKHCSRYKKIACCYFVDKDRPFFWKTYLFEQDPVCNLHGIYKVYSWEISDYNIQLLPPSNFPNISYHQSIRDPSIAISTIQWSDIANYCIKLQKSNFFPDPPQDIVELIQKWKNTCLTQEEQILAAIHLVSDDIYYVSVPDEEEEHYFTPYSPNKTLQNHYGDCKDKTSLLIAILRLLDVEAHPVLVSTTKTYELKNELPNPCFDHVITNIEYDSKSYFIDPTLSLQGGNLDTYQIPDYGYGLIVKEDSEDLIPITRNFLSKTQSTATISIQDEDATWDHTVQFCHSDADNIRNELIPEYINKETKSVLNYIRDALPDTQVIYTSPLQVADDRQANIITKKFSLSLKNIGKETATGIVYDLTLLVSNMVSLTDDIDFSQVLSLETYKSFDEEIYRTIDIHCDKSPTIEEKKISYTDDNMSYSITLEKISDTHVQVILYQKFFVNYVEVDQLPYFFKKLEEFRNHLSLIIEIPT